MNIKKEMADCTIPVNITMRRKELKGLTGKIDGMKKEFNDLKIAYKNSQDKSDTQDIKDLISKIDQILSE